MCRPGQLLKLSTDELLRLQHDAMLELLRRYPPTWPHIHVYNTARRVFDATRELHQATEQLARADDHQPVADRQPVYPGIRVTDNGPEP